MSEKRFRIDMSADKRFCIVDTKSRKIYSSIMNDSVVDLMNQLSEENEQLRNELLKSKKTVSSIQEKINNYYNEICSK